MAFHVNPQTGEAGPCRALADGCPFGNSDEHFTSMEAARAFFEDKIHADEDSSTNTFATFDREGLKDDLAPVNTPEGKRRVSSASGVFYSEMGSYADGPAFEADRDDYEAAVDARRVISRAAKVAAVGQLVQVIENPDGDFSPKDIEDALFVLSAAESEGRVSPEDTRKVIELVKGHLATGALQEDADQQSYFLAAAVEESEE